MTNPRTELGRVTRAYVSAFTRTRVHRVNVMAQEKRCLVANFNGALEAGRWIATAVWSVNIPTFVNLLNCDITTDGRETACLMSAQWRGRALVRCTVTLDNGDAQTQYFDAIIDGSYFHNDVIPAAGPYQISAMGYNPGPGNSVVLSGALGNGAFKDVVSYQYTLAGGIPPRIVSLASGHLPDGLSLYGSGIVAGTRTTPGTYTFNLLATDSNGNSFTLPDTSMTFSTDLFTWVTVNDGLAQQPLSSWISGSTVIVATSNNSLAVSLDRGVTWATKSVSSVLTSGVAYIIKFNGDWYIFSAASTSQSAKTSGDSLNFTGFSNSPSINSLGILDGKLYAGEYSTGSNYRLMKLVSPGSAWSAIDTGIMMSTTYNAISGMVRTPTAFLFCTTDGVVIRSTDLLSFTKTLITATYNFFSIAYVNGVLIASSTGGWYRSNDDGVTWTTAQSIPQIRYVVQTTSIFISAFNNVISKSQDGVTWTTVHTQSTGGNFQGNPSTDGALAVFPILSSYASIGSP
jgi:hypothetical protein